MKKIITGLVALGASAVLLVGLSGCTGTAQADAPPATAPASTPSVAPTPTPTPTVDANADALFWAWAVEQYPGLAGVGADAKETAMQAPKDVCDRLTNGGYSAAEIIEAVDDDPDNELGRIMVTGAGRFFCPSKNAEITAAYATRDAAAEPAEPTVYSPKKSDVELTLKRKSKQCFGSAGCNVVVETRLKTGAALPDSGTLTIYYKIKGGEDGAIEGTVEADLSDGTYYKQSEVVSTQSSGTKVTVTVTDVEYSEY